MRATALAILSFVSTAALSADVLPSPDQRVNRTLPDDYELRKDTEYQKKYLELTRQEDAAREALLGAAPGKAPAAAPNGPEVLPAPVGAQATEGMWPAPATSAPSAATVVPQTAPRLPRQLPKRTKVAPNRLIATPAEAEAAVAPAMIATPVLTFAVSQQALDDEMTSVLPAGSFVKAKVFSGVEANTLEPYPVLLHLEYAFTGPNKTKIDLSNCFMIAKARANLSTERAQMQTDKISCVRDNGESFTAPANAWVAGNDSTFGVAGVLISKQGQVLLAAVLASIAKNAGEAVALAQTTTTVGAGALGNAQTASNVTGDQAKYIAGRSVVDGASMIAQWYLDYAKQLVPSIAVGSGEDVHVIMMDTIRVPLLNAE